MISKARNNDPIRFRMSDENLIIIDASVNGNSVPMILDTGAGATVISKKAAKAMDLSSICEKLGDEVDGIVGHDFLSKTKLTIDYPEKLLYLEISAVDE